MMILNKLFKLLKSIILLSFLLFNYQPTLAAGLEYVSVDVEGRGASVREAIDIALTEAIGRVNGKSIESSTLLITQEKSVQDNEDSDYYSSQEYQDTIASKTKGQVKEYSIISKNKENDSEFWVVKLKATIAKYNVSKSAKRKRIAVLPLQARGDCCTMIGQSANPVFASEELSRGLSNSLVQSRKFTVLDRDYINERSSEKDVLRSGEVPSEELAKLGQELFSDYIMVGTITTAKVSEITKTMRTNNMSFKEMSGIIQFSYRIIDVPTSQVKFSSNATINVSNSELKEEGVSNQNAPGELLYALINVGAKKIGQNVLNAIFPVLVESLKGNYVVLGQGGETIKKGQRMQLILRGEKVIDSYTRESLGRSEEVIGEIEITGVTSKQSYGKVISSAKEDLESLFKPKMMLVRPFSDSKNKEQQKKEIKNKREDRKKKFNEDW